MGISNAHFYCTYQYQMQYLLYSNLFDLDIKLREELNNEKVTARGVHPGLIPEGRPGPRTVGMLASAKGREKEPGRRRLGLGCMTGTPIYWAVPEGPR